MYSVHLQHRKVLTFDVDRVVERGQEDPHIPANVKLGDPRNWVLNAGRARLAVTTLPLALR